MTTTILRPFADGGRRRILFTSYPLYGHVNPMLPLTVAARRAGHEVAFATGSDMVPPVERRGVAAWPVGPTHAEATAAAGPWFAATAGKRAVDLVPRAVAWKPDVVISDEFELAGVIAAATAGARHVVHGLGVMPPTRIWEMLKLDPALERLHRQWNTAAGAGSIRDAVYLEACPPSLRPEGERIWNRARPLRPVAGEPVADERLPDAIDALPHARTVHLTLGTLFHETPGVLETAVAGLRELPVNLVVTSGPGTDPARFGPQPANVLIAPYLPHTLLLPRCVLVVSQGGAGIMFGALANGLPQLMLPQGADQFINADACTSAGAALSLASEELTAAAVTAARFLAEPEFTTAAAAVRVEIESMPSADTVLATLTEEV